MNRPTNIRYDRDRFRLPPVLIALLLALCSEAAMAHGGEDHGEAAAAAPTPASTGSQLSTHGQTGLFELMLKYPPPETGEDARLRFFLADYATNRPIEGATMALAFKPSGVTLVGAPTMVSPGVYDLVARFPKDGIYSVVATVKASGRTDFVEIRNIYAGEAAEKFLAEHGGTETAVVALESSGSIWKPALIGLGAIAVAGIVYLVLRSRRNRTLRSSPGAIDSSEQESMASAAQRPENIESKKRDI